MIHFFLDCLFPVRSLSGGEGEWVKTDELRSLRTTPVILDRAQLRSMSVQSLDRVIGAVAYKEVPLLRRAVHLLKYRRVRGVAKPLGQLLLKATTAIDGDPVLCPVPLHWTRQFSRGFNQSALLAEVLARERGWPVASCLRRARKTGSQVGRGREERLTAMTDAFVVRGSLCAKHVVLVDDLCTTGATLDACAAALKKAGAETVEALVVAVD